jgi:hypothetical protein
MTVPEVVQPASPSPTLGTPMPMRILIFALGLLLLAFGALITLGTELIAILAMVVAWYVLKRKGRTLTHGKAWLASVGGTMVPVFVLLIGSMLSSPMKMPTATERKAAMERQQRVRDSMPELLKKLTANQRQVTPAADSIADKLLQNKKVMLWMSGMAAVLGSVMIGAFAGTLGWGAGMLLYRAARDEWLGAAPLISP